MNRIDAKEIIKKFIQEDLCRNDTDNYDNNLHLELETQRGDLFIIYDFKILNPFWTMNFYVL